jgi:hypothetical protein
MSARIFVHPRANAPLVDLCVRWGLRGYAICNTRRGYMEAKPIPVLNNVVKLKRNSPCPQP